MIMNMSEDSSQGSSHDGVDQTLSNVKEEDGSDTRNPKLSLGTPPEIPIDEDIVQTHKAHAHGGDMETMIRNMVQQMGEDSSTNDSVGSSTGERNVALGGVPEDQGDLHPQQTSVEEKIEFSMPTNDMESMIRNMIEDMGEDSSSNGSHASNSHQNRRSDHVAEEKVDSVEAELAQQTAPSHNSEQDNHDSHHLPLHDMEAMIRNMVQNMGDDSSEESSTKSGNNSKSESHPSTEGNPKDPMTKSLIDRNTHVLEKQDEDGQSFPATVATTLDTEPSTPARGEGSAIDTQAHLHSLLVGSDLPFDLQHMKKESSTEAKDANVETGIILNSENVNRSDEKSFQVEPNNQLRQPPSNDDAKSRGPGDQPMPAHNPNQRQERSQFAVIQVPAESESVSTMRSVTSNSGSFRTMGSLLQSAGNALGSTFAGSQRSQQNKRADQVRRQYSIHSSGSSVRLRNVVSNFEKQLATAYASSSDSDSEEGDVDDEL